MLLHKLTGKVDPESVSLSESLEVKVMSLQQQLRELQMKTQSSSTIACSSSSGGADTTITAVDGDSVTSSVPMRNPADRFGGGRFAIGRGRGRGRGGGSWVAPGASGGRMRGGWVLGAGRGRGFINNTLTPTSADSESDQHASTAGADAPA